ncbi:MAG: hypothetical protein JWO98_3778, partial [Frankiales bacterium]|nr:hypothetical protein [Frankiales bacterium]
SPTAVLGGARAEQDARDQADGRNASPRSRPEPGQGHRAITSAWRRGRGSIPSGTERPIARARRSAVPVCDNGCWARRFNESPGRLRTVNRCIPSKRCCRTGPPQRAGGAWPALGVSSYRAGIRAGLNVDDVEQLAVSARTPDAHRQAAARLLSWAEERHRQDELTPADLISDAAWHLDQAGDKDSALTLHRRGVTAEGTTTPDARRTLAAALLDAGRADGARQVADDPRRSGPRIINIAGMAEVFELVGDLQWAHRWAAMGVNRLDLATEEHLIEDVEVELLLNVRRRVRQALGFPPDAFDELGD